MESTRLKQTAERPAPTRAEMKQYLLNLRRGFEEVERREFAEAMQLTPTERLWETLELCTSAAEFAREDVTVETYLADTQHWRRLAEAWKAKRS